MKEQGSWYIKEETVERLRDSKRKAQYKEDVDMTQNEFIEFLLDFWEDNQGGG